MLQIAKNKMSQGSIAIELGIWQRTLQISIYVHIFIYTSIARILTYLYIYTIHIYCKKGAHILLTHLRVYTSADIGTCDRQYMFTYQRIRVSVYLCKWQSIRCEWKSDAVQYYIWLSIECTSTFLHCRM